MNPLLMPFYALKLNKIKENFGANDILNLSYERRLGYVQKAIIKNNLEINRSYNNMQNAEKRGDDHAHKLYKGANKGARERRQTLEAKEAKLVKLLGEQNEN